ncbi:MAG: twin-arginine translocase TatA/TatE family subunit [Oligoflexia bacterium]|nr:twin-arginine translocase TatA/TatE family subunit [Oligoflexia bacterium]
MGQFSFWHLLLVLGIVLIVFGPGRLPGLGASLGKAIRGFKEGLSGLNDETNSERPAQTTRESLPPTDRVSTVQKDSTNNKTNS